MSTRFGKSKNQIQQGGKNSQAALKIIAENAENQSGRGGNLPPPPSAVTEAETSQLIPPTSTVAEEEYDGGDDETQSNILQNSAQYQARIVAKTNLAKSLLGKVNANAKAQIAYQLAKTLARNENPQAKLKPFDVTNFSSIIVSQDPQFSKLEKGFLTILAKFFKFNPKNANRLIFRKIPKDDITTRNNIFYRPALRIAKLIKASDQYANINYRNLTEDYLSKRAELAKAARTGSVSYMLNKQLGWLKKYNTTVPAEAKTYMNRALAAGLAKTQSRVTKMFDTGVQNLSGFNTTTYNNYKQVQDATRTNGSSSMDVEAIRKDLLGIR